MIRVTPLGFQPGFGAMPGFWLFNLIDPAGDIPPGSTVSRATVEKYGTLVEITSK